MFRVRMVYPLVMAFAVFLSSCAPSATYTLPPDLTLAPGTDIPHQVATYVSNALTQTAMPPATSTPVFAVTAPPVGGEATIPPISVALRPSAQVLYQSPVLGVQFRYPAMWFRRETNDGVMLTSFDPANPPHKLEWGYETTSMYFRQKVFVTRPAFDQMVEDTRQASQAEGWSIYAEERFLIANQPAVRLTLVSGSGGTLNRVLIYELNARYITVDIEGNYNNALAKTVLDSMWPYTPGGTKPADSDTPAAGICAEPQGDPVSIVLGTGPDGIPLAGRCIRITPSQRIKLLNQSTGPFNILFGDFPVDLLVGDEVLLDKPASQYLASGVHFLPMGPELWVKETVVATVPPPIVEYNNPTVGYKLNLPGNWVIDENGMTNGLNKEVVFNPPNPEPFIAYLSISLDSRTLDQIINLYAQSVPDAIREDVVFNGYPGIKYTYIYQNNVYHVDYYIPYGGRIYAILTDRPNDNVVQSILMTIRFTVPPQSVTYDATMADNGKTFVMNIGDKLRLNLDYGYGWATISDFNPAILVGAADGYFAFARGTTTLTMIGNPLCLNSTPPCLAPSITYSVTVIVQ